MSEKRFDDSIAVSAPFSRIRRRDTRDGVGSWWDGEVVTPQGIVSVYSDERYTRLDFVYGGRLYMRNDRGGKRTERGLAILAGRFAREIAGGNR